MSDILNRPYTTSITISIDDMAEFEKKMIQWKELTELHLKSCEVCNGTAPFKYCWNTFYVNPIDVSVE